MALPNNLARYDGLIDMVVEQLVREIEQVAEMKTPTGSRLPVGVRINTLNQWPANDTHQIESPANSRRPQA